MALEHGSGFRVAGYLVKLWVSPKGNFAKLTVEVPSHKGGRQKIDIKCFSEAIGQVARLGEGMEVQITGSIGIEKLTDREKNEIKVNGYSVWMPALVAKTIKVEPKKDEPAGEPAGWD